MKRIKKTFEIETSPDVMERIERFLALLHHNSNFGHSSIFGMPLDGDGADKVVVSPRPQYAYEVDCIGGVGCELELAVTGGYTCAGIKESKSNWLVRPTGSLYKDDDLHKTIPSRIHRD